MSGPVTPGHEDAGRAGPLAVPPASADSGAATAHAGRPGNGWTQRRYLLGVLTALVPGLGHLVGGRRGLGLVFAAPVVVGLALLATILATVDRAQLVARLVSPDVLLAILGIQVALLAWRLLALGSILRWARPPALGRRDAVPVALLVAFVLAPQLYLGYVTNVARVTAQSVFDPGPVTVWRPTAPPPTPVPSGATPAPPSPSPSPTPSTPRLTVLLIGMDSGVGRQTALTDTMIVASLDPVGGTVSMLSVPRDLVDAPLPGGGVFRPKINELVTDAQRNPAAFPGSNGNGQAVLAGTLSELLGVQIDYWAQVNLGGLIRIVDTVGGVDVNVAHAFCDPSYDEYGQNGFSIAAGRWHLNGSQALAYARVRKAAGESDFTRAARQQEVLVGLRDAVVRGSFLADPVGFLQALGGAVRTNVPPSLLPQVATFAEKIGRNRVYRAVIQSPLVRSSFDVRGSIQVPDVAAIRTLAASLFPAPGVVPAGAASSPSPTTPSTGGIAPRPGSTSCHAAPTPRPSSPGSPSPSPGSSGSASLEPSASASSEPTAAPKPTPTPASDPSASPAASTGAGG